MTNGRRVAITPFLSVMQAPCARNQPNVRSATLGGDSSGRGSQKRGWRGGVSPFHCGSAISAINLASSAELHVHRDAVPAVIPFSSST